MLGLADGSGLMPMANVDIIPFGPTHGGRYLPRAIALRIMSFLPSPNLYSVSLVCKVWDHLAMDDALWDFTSTGAVAKDSPSTGAGGGGGAAAAAASSGPTGAQAARGASAAALVSMRHPVHPPSPMDAPGRSSRRTRGASRRMIMA